MTFLLDTDHISILQKQSGPEYPRLMARIAQVRRADLAFCIVVARFPKPVGLPGPVALLLRPNPQERTVEGFATRRRRQK